MIIVPGPSWMASITVNALLAAGQTGSETFIDRYWPELLFTLVGAFLPFAAQALWALIRFVRVLIEPTRHPETALLGSWSVYHFSRREEKQLMRSEQWQLKLNWRGRIVIRTSDAQVAKLIYKGRLEDTDTAQLTCRMRGALHHEEFYVRIVYPIPSNHESTFGIKVGENFDHDIYSTLYLFSRQALSHSVASKRLRQKLDQCLRPEFNGLLLRPGDRAAPVAP